MRYLQERVSNSHHPSSEFGLGRRKHVRRFAQKKARGFWGEDGAMGFGEKKRTMRERETMYCVLCDQFHEREEENLFSHIMFHLSFFLNLKGHTILQFSNRGFNVNGLKTVA